MNCRKHTKYSVQAFYLAFCGSRGGRLGTTLGSVCRMPSKGAYMAGAATGKVYDEARIRAEYADLTRLLIARGLQITTMESATSGQIASLITDTEGASAVLKGAYVTYCNEAKVKNGVPAEVIATHTVYSLQTAEAMATACRRSYQANVGIGVTGTMGNVDPANAAASEPGNVYFAICLSRDGTQAGEKVHSFHVQIEPQPTRLMYKLAVAKEVRDRLVDLLT